MSLGKYIHFCGRVVPEFIYNILKTKIETLRSVLICICLGGYFERS